MQAVKTFVSKLTDSSSDDDDSYFPPSETDKLLNSDEKPLQIVIDNSNNTSDGSPHDVDLENLSGLTAQEADRRFSIYGANVIESKKESLFVTILKHLFLSLISVLIWLAVVTTCIVRDWIDLGVLIFLQVTYYSKFCML